MAKQENQYLSFLVDPDLLTRLDDFRYLNRFPTRAAAIKYLLDKALGPKLTPSDPDNFMRQTKESLSPEKRREITAALKAKLKPPAAGAVEE